MTIVRIGNGAGTKEMFINDIEHEFISLSSGVHPTNQYVRQLLVDQLAIVGS